MHRPVRRLLCHMALALLAAPAWAQQSAVELKAQVLVKVLRFVEWPPGSLVEGQPLQVCLLDDGALARQLQSLDGQAVNTHPLRVRPRAGRGAALGGCHVALMGAATTPESPGLLLVGEEAM